MDVRIYYEDTDAAGVVYHANYIKYLERARTEFFRNHDFLVSKLAEAGYIFPVVRLELDFKSPARHDDLLSVATTSLRTSGASFTNCQAQRGKAFAGRFSDSGLREFGAKGTKNSIRNPSPP
jgi:tol-pal system-associated acyl-CoA thioesterase